MKNRIPGLASILLLFAALGIAAVHLFTVSFILGTVYTVYIPAAFLLVFYEYCRKCPHAADNSCMHVVFGKITKRLFRLEEPSKYKPKELIAVILSLGIVVIFPQFWLYHNPVLLAAFWILTLIAVILVVTSVCTKCRNGYCKFCKNASKCKLHN